jgi:hypothetical protein
LQGSAFFYGSVILVLLYVNKRFKLMLRVSQTTVSVRYGDRRGFLNGPARIAVLAFLVCLSARVVAGQGAAEYGLAVAGAATNVAGASKAIGPAVAAAVKSGSMVAPDKKAAPAAPVSVPAVTVPFANATPDVANRQALEKLAGKDAAKLTLKSVPPKASVRIDGKDVGQTPLLLTLAPGHYKIEMTGPRMEFGTQQVELHPQETRELELPLSAAPKYPTQIWLR